MNGNKRSAKVAILTNFVPPMRLPVFEHISRQADTTVFLDTVSEKNRRWEVNHGSLRVDVVPGLTFECRYHHPVGFTESVFLHVPVGLIPRLFRMAPSHIISGELGFRTAVACLYRLLRPSTRLVLWTEGTPHTDRYRGLCRSVWRRVLLKVPDVVVATSTAARDLLVSYGASEATVMVSLQSSGFRRPEIAPVRNVRQRRRLLYAGRFIPLKGLRPFMAALIRICQRLPRTFVQLWLIGSGEEEGWLRSLDLPRTLTLRILRPVPLERMPEIYRRCGILVFPTLADVWGLVTNEAMAYSMPVLGSRHAQSVCDLVKDGKSGWTFFPDDNEGMEQAIHTALTADLGELERMGQCARRAVENITPERFGHNLLCAAFGELYSSNS